MAGTRYDAVPKRPGFVATAVVWKKDHGRFRVQQVCYEPKGRQAPDREPARRDRGLVQRELF